LEDDIDNKQQGFKLLSKNNCLNEVTFKWLTLWFVRTRITLSLYDNFGGFLGGFQDQGEYCFYNNFKVLVSHIISFSL